jgi:hypothetical protein
MYGSTQQVGPYVTMLFCFIPVDEFSDPIQAGQTLRQQGGLRLLGKQRHDKVNVVYFCVCQWYCAPFNESQG